MNKYQKQAQLCDEIEAGIYHARLEAIDFLNRYGHEAAVIHGNNITNAAERNAYFAALNEAR